MKDIGLITAIFFKISSIHSLQHVTKVNEMGKKSYLDFFVHCNVSQFKKKPGEWQKKNSLYIRV